MTIGNNTEMQTLYASEVNALYDRTQSFFRGTVITKGEVKGNSYVFIIGPIADMAVERGADGDIPLLADNQTNATCTLKEYHALARKNGFNIASSSVDQRGIMQKQTIASMNKRTDDLIITQLDTTAYSSGAAATGNALGFWLEGKAALGANDVPTDDGKLWCAITPYAEAQMLRIDRLTSSDYVDDRPFMKGRKIREIMGVKFFVHTGLPGDGTSDATCFMYHEDAVGHAMNMGEQSTVVGYDGEQDRSWARTSSYQGSKMIQDEGVFELHHDDTAALV